jgi:hypothetical protein
MARPYLVARTDNKTLGHYPCAMNLLKRLFRRLQSPPGADDRAAVAEAERLRDQMETIRLSQRAGSAGENYQSGRGSL